LLKRVCASLCVCVLAHACAAPTRGVSGVTAVVEPATQYSPCPVFMKTVGIITGSPSSPVTYRFIGNGLPWSPPHHSIIPSSGVLKVIERSRVDKAQAGFFFRQVWVIVDGGALDKFSNRTLYINTCGAPLTLATTVDPTTCADHVEPRTAGAFCGAALAAGHPMFIWSSGPDSCKGGACKAPVDGYSIYQVSGKSEHLVATQTNPRLTVAALAEKASALTGNCYVVRAFRGTDESPESNQLCVRPARGETLMRVALKPVMTRHGVGDNAIVLFDLSTLSGAAIWNARLEFAGGPAGRRLFSFESCIATVDLATADTREHSVESVPYASYVNVNSSTPTDVTSAVRAWVQGTRPNYGFVLRAPEISAAKSDRMCRSFEGKSTLAIDYLNL